MRGRRRKVERTNGRRRNEGGKTAGKGKKVRRKGGGI